MHWKDSLPFIALMVWSACPPPLLSQPPNPGVQTLPFIPLEIKDGESIDLSDHWVTLNVEGRAYARREGGQRLLILENNARLRSRDVASYPDQLGLFAEWVLLNNQGAMGFGFIDFSTSIYYYLYQDGDAGEWALQRGDATGMKQLARMPLSGIAGPVRMDLQIAFPKRDQVALTVLVNGQPAGEPIIDRPPMELGSTFQMYVGSGNDAQVAIREISTVPAGQRKKSGNWFW